MSTEAVPDLAAEVLPHLLETELVRAVLSGRQRGSELVYRRAEMRRVVLKGVDHLQVVLLDDRQAFTSNFSLAGSPNPEGEPGLRDVLLLGWANAHLEFTDGRAVAFRITKRGKVLSHVSRAQPTGSAEAKPPATGAVEHGHDRVKQRMLEPDHPVLVALGISDGSQIRPSRTGKHRQIEEFVRLLLAAVGRAQRAGRLSTDKTLRIVDLGCGNAYLTFAAKAALEDRGIPCDVLGIDVKEQSREHNEAVARELQMSGITFAVSTIQDAEISGCDVVLALHACDTATDDAIAAAVKAGAALVMAAPCCHHDIQTQLNAGAAPSPHGLLVRHGYVRERFGDVLTDALRAELLALLGYKVQVVEFVGSQHTPRNSLIVAHNVGRAVRMGSWEEWDGLLEQWRITPQLAELLREQMSQARAKTGLST